MQNLSLDTLVGEDVMVLIGHDRGVAARAKLGLDGLDHVAEPVAVSVPSHLLTLTPSFVQGLFAESVHYLGEERFFDHYQFAVPAHILSDIRAGVDRVLTSRHLAGV